MDCISLILEKLEYRDIKATVSEFAINWLDYMDYENSIQLGNMDCSGDKLAWFQTNDKDEHLLRVYEGSESFDWKPITYNPYFGCTCHLLEWVGDTLVLIYSEKHDTYICSIKNKEVRSFDFSGDRLAREGEVIFFSEYYDGDIIRRIRIPELEELEPISKEHAEQRGITIEFPFGVNPLKRVR